MPGPLVKGHVLHHTPVAVNDHMRRDAQTLQNGERWMLGGINGTHKQLINVGLTKLAGGQTDAMHH